ncbi:MAG: PEP-CTERM sorting domain-containing protein [Phycisphaerales bacterium JB063]
MNRMIKTLAVLAAVGVSQTASAELLWMDNFNVADGDLNASNPPAGGRITGSLAGEASPLEAFGTLQNITNQSLALVSIGGARFGGETDRFNWATSSAAGDIVAAGGMTFSYDWNPGDNTDGEWHAIIFGTGNADGSGVNAGSSDYGILLRNADSGGNISQGFDNGTLVGSTDSSVFTPSSNTTYSVVHTLLFDSFNAGANVQIISTVDGVEFGNAVIQWENSNDLRIDIAAQTGGHTVDNVAIETIPEPGSLALLGLGGLLIARRRRD